MNSNDTNAAIETLEHHGDFATGGATGTELAELATDWLDAVGADAMDAWIEAGCFDARSAGNLAEVMSATQAKPIGYAVANGDMSIDEAISIVTKGGF